MAVLYLSTQLRDIARLQIACGRPGHWMKYPKGIQFYGVASLNLWTLKCGFYGNRFEKWTTR